MMIWRIASAIAGRALAAALVAAAFVAVSTPAAADDAKCRAAIHKASSRYASMANKAVEACRKEQAKTGAEAPDCLDLDQADVRGKVAAAADKLRASIAKACTASDSAALAMYPSCPSPAQATDDGGDSTGIDDFEELATCLLALNRSAVERLHRETAANASASEAALRCRATLTKSAVKLWSTLQRERGKCQVAAEKISASPLAFNDCATADAKNKIAGGFAKAAKAIDKRCAGLPVADAASLGSCANHPADLSSCVLRAVLGAASASSAAAFEFPGTCPSSLQLEQRAGMVADASGGVRASSSRLDIGWTGWAHGVNPAEVPAGRFDLDCSTPDCESCAVAASCDGDSCRCEGQSWIPCDDPFATGGPCGAGRCVPMAAPPVPLVSSGLPMCIASSLDAPPSGTFDAGSGQWDVQYQERSFQGLGASLVTPCPVCVAGTCSGGLRGGQPCVAEGEHSPFGSTSRDCPPSPASGQSRIWSIAETSGEAAPLVAIDACESPNEALACTCGVCSGDTDQTCTSDAECDDLGLGTCGNGSGPARKPNECDGFACEPLEAGSIDGVCSTGPDELHCDGLVTLDGRGIVPCLDDAGCEVLSLGTCSLVERRRCLLDPVAASGSLAWNGADHVAAFCAPSLWTIFLSSLGLPGPVRSVRSVQRTAYCADGITEYTAGGAGCP